MMCSKVYIEVPCAGGGYVPTNLAIKHNDFAFTQILSLDQFFLCINIHNTEHALLVQRS